MCLTRHVTTAHAQTQGADAHASGSEAPADTRGKDDVVLDGSGAAAAWSARANTLGP
jgi:hypothetical protein